MAGAFAGPLKGSRVIDQPQDVRFLNEDTAIVISEGGIIFPDRTPCRARGTVRATWVLAKRDDRWHVTAYHYGGLSGWSYGREWASAEMPCPPGTAWIV